MRLGLEYPHIKLKEIRKAFEGVTVFSNPFSLTGSRLKSTVWRGTGVNIAEDEEFKQKEIYATKGVLH